LGWVHNRSRETGIACTLMQKLSFGTKDKTTMHACKLISVHSRTLTVYTKLQLYPVQQQ